MRRGVLPNGSPGLTGLVKFLMADPVREFEMAIEQPPHPMHSFDMSLDDLLRRRFASFRTIYLPTAGRLARYQFELLPTGQSPHFTVRLHSADSPELARLLAALGAPQANSQYARGKIWREED